MGITNVAHSLGFKSYISLTFHIIFSASVVAHILLSVMGTLMWREITKPIPILSITFLTGLVWAQCRRTKILYSVATILSAVADVLIVFQFQIAVGLFFIVHIIYSIEFTFPSTLTQKKALQSNSQLTPPSRFFPDHYPLHPLRFIIPFLIQLSVLGVVISRAYNQFPIYILASSELYGILISIEVWRAASVIGSEASHEERFYSKIRLFGSFLFFVSDLLVTIQALSPLPFNGNQVYIFLILLYYIGQYLIGRSTASEQLYNAQFEPLIEENSINDDNDDGDDGIDIVV